MRKTDEARRNREAMPLTARIVDEWRAVFGPGTRFTWVREGEVERGRRGEAGREMNADQWLRYVKTGEMPC